MKYTEKCRCYKTFKSIFCFVMIFTIMLMSTIIQTNAVANENSDNLLFVYDNNNWDEAKNYINTEANKIDVDFISLNEFSVKKASDYTAIAYPFSSVQNVQLKHLFAEHKIYLYGELTINNYKDAVGLNDFSIFIDSDIVENNEIPKQKLSNEYETNEIFNLICYDASPLLCKISSDNTTPFLKAIINDINESSTSVGERSHTIVKSQFNFRLYFELGAYLYVLNMDYSLYRNTNESDSTYDYFGIKTNTWCTDPTGDKTIKQVETKYSFPKASDELMECGPDTDTNIGTLEVAVGYGDGASGQIAYQMDLSDTKPNITKTANYTADTVQWIMTPRTLFPKSISDTISTCSATWASTGKSAQIDVDFQAVVSYGTNNQYRYYTGYYNVPVVYNY